MEMDIAKYVGLFLVKNEYCFLPGIGSLQIEKKPAVYDKESQSISAPVHEVKFRTSGGSIDDSFANFIANNERISIAHASNHLKDFCAKAKADLKEGKEVIIPAIGKFVGNAQGAIQFVTDPHLHIEGRAVPFFKNSAAVEQKKEEAISNIIERTNIREPKADEAIEYKAPSVNWGKILILAGIVLIVLAGAIYLLTYMAKSKEADAVENVSTDQAPAPMQTEAQPETRPDTLPEAVTEAPAPAVTETVTPLQSGPDGTITYKVALQQYGLLEKAESRVAKLKSYGNKGLEVIDKGNDNYVVAMSVTSLASDTARVMDSLKRMFNPSGNVHIIK